MSAIDERIVAMRFDNAQFEKGVRTSMRTLEDLKAASNLNDVAGNLSDFSKNFNKTLNFDGTTKDAGIFSKALTGLGQVAKKTFNASTFPLQALGRSLKSFGSYTRAMLGIDLASSLVNTGKTVLRAFTIDPLRSGWSEYELKMDSIKTIMTGTVDTYKKMMEKKNPGFLYDEEKHLDYVKQGLEELNTYADKTIYSFQDMTTSVGKFTNAGIEFDKAVSAVKGIANVAAFAGQGATQASSAMYNFAQSLGIGHLERIDWRSIENAQMATPAFKQTMIDLGLALGTLKKEGEEVYALTEQGLIDKNTIVTMENFRDTLSSKWVTNDVLLGALSVFSGELSKDELKDMFHFTDEMAQKFYDLGQQASKSATQVRTFTKMWDALKEAAQSGWATTWELIFGDMNEATDFWTSLNDRFSGILDSMANGRNDLLKRWRGQGRYWNYSTGEWYWKQVPDAKDGRKILIDGLNDLLDVLQRLGGAIGTAWEKVFGVLTADKLVNLTEKFSGFTAKLKSWLGDANKDGTRLNKITKGFQGLFGMLKGGGTLIKGAVTTVANTLHLDKLIDLGINAFSGIGEWLTGVAGSIESVWNKIGQTEIAQKLSGFFSELWDSVSKFFGEVNPDTGKTGFAEWLESTTGRIAEIWETFTGSDFFQNASNFFGNLFNGMVVFFKSKNRYDNRGFLLNDNRSDFQVMIDNVLEWFDGAWKTISSKWTEFTNSDFYKNAANLFNDLWASVISFFQPKNRYDNRGFLLNDNRSDFKVMVDNLLGWFDDGWNKITEKWNKFKSSDFYKNASTLISDLWESVTGFFKPKPITGKTGSMFPDHFIKVASASMTDFKFASTAVSEEKSDFQIMVDNLLGWFDEGWNKITEKWNNFKSSDFYKNASTLISDLWESVTGFFKPKNRYDNRGFLLNDNRSDFKVMIDNIVELFADGWNTISEKFNASSFGEFIDSAKETFDNKFSEFKTWSSTKLEEVQSFFDGEPWSTIISIFTEIDSVLFSSKKQKASSTTGTEEKVNFFSRVLTDVEHLYTLVKDWDKWDDISGFFKSIGDLFTAATEAVKGSWLGKNAGTVLEMVLESVKDVFTIIHDLLDWFITEDTIFKKDANGNIISETTERVELWKLVVAGVVALMGQITTFASSLAISSSASAFKQMSKVFLSIALMVGAISVFTALVAILPSNIRDTALTIVGLLTLSVFVVSIVAEIISAAKKMPTIKELVKETIWNTVTTTLGNLIENIIKWVGIISLFRYGIPPIIESLKGLDTSWDKILSVFGGITLFAVAILGFEALFAKMNIGIVESLNAVGGFAILVFGSIWSILLTLQSIGGLANLWPDAIDAIKGGAKFLGEVASAFKVGLLGEEVSATEFIESFGAVKDSLVTLGEAGAEVNLTGLTQLEEAMSSIQRITRIKINDASIFSQWFAGELTLDQQMEKMANFGKLMVGFNNNLKDAEGNDIDFTNMLTALKAWASMASILQSLTYIRQSGMDIDTWFSGLMSLMGSGTDSGWNTLRTFISSFGESVNDGLLLAAETIDADPIIKAIVDSLNGGKSQIEDATKNLFSDGSKTESPSAGANKVIEEHAEQVAEQTKSNYEILQDYLYAALVGKGNEILNGGLVDFSSALLSGLNGPQGILGLLGIGSLINGSLADEAGTLPLNLGPILGQLFNVDVNNLMPEGSTLESVLGIIASGDSEKIKSAISEVLGIDADNLDIESWTDVTIQDLTGIFSQIEGYEGSAIQQFFATNDPSSTVSDIIAQYLPEGLDLNSIDWSNPLAIMSAFGSRTSANGQPILDLGSLFDKEAVAKWFGLSSDQIDFSNLQSSIQSIVPALYEAIDSGLREGFTSLNTPSLFDEIWNYLGVDSALITFTDLKTDVTTIVASIVPSIADGIKEGLSESISDFNLFDGLFDWLGADKANVDTSSLRSFISSVTPSVISEIKNGFIEGIKGEPLLGFVAKNLFKNGSGLNEAVSNVFDASNLDDMPMLSLQNGTLVLSGTVGLDDSSVASITSAIHSEGSGIRSAINALGGRMDNVAASIRAIKIVLNTGVIAGAVDDAMGKSTVMHSRTGTSSGNTAHNFNEIKEVNAVK